MPADAGITTHESRLLRTSCSRNRRLYSQSGLLPYLLIQAGPSDVQTYWRASTPLSLPAVRDFQKLTEGEGRRAYYALPKNFMIKDVARIALPTDETLLIRKQRLLPEKKSERKHRICIVTGIHGDELEGQYVCYLLMNRIRSSIQDLHAVVDIYPSMNPLGMDSIQRGIPLFDLDMNRIFPGSSQGTMAEYTASRIVEDAAGADVAIDIHASNIFLKEMPQVRINEITAEKLVPMAEKLNLELIWVHPNATVLESTFAHSMNSRGVPTLVVELGVGMRITQSYGKQLTEGILSLMKEMGFWSGECEKPRKPVIMEGDCVEYMNAAASGVFVPAAEHGSFLKKGQHIGDIINPLSGSVETKVLSPCDGLLFTLREYPMVYEGSLVARILRGNEDA